MMKTNLFLRDDNNDDELLIEEIDLNSDSNSNDADDNSREGEEMLRISRSKVNLIRKLVANIKDSNDKILQLLYSEQDSMSDEIKYQMESISTTGSVEMPGEGRIVEGIFDGENMIGPDGKQYSIPANYASKSKLVEGDILKLTIRDNGTFVYKQIGPIERVRLVGVLEKNENGNFYANVEGKRWRLITASVTYYRGQSGDEIVILIPEKGESKWAAVENIVRNAK